MKKSSKSVPTQTPVRIVTRQVAADESLEEIVHFCKSNVRYGLEKIEAFRVRLGENPVSAFEWSSDAFTAAARVEVAKTILRYKDEMEKKVDAYEAFSAERFIVEMRDFFMEQVMNKAKWPEHSSSPGHNHMSLCLNSAKAEAVEKLDQAINRIERKSKVTL